MIAPVGGQRIVRSRHVPGSMALSCVGGDIPPNESRRGASRGERPTGVPRARRRRQYCCVSCAAHPHYFFVARVSETKAGDGVRALITLPGYHFAHPGE